MYLVHVIATDANGDEVDGHKEEDEPAEDWEHLKDGDQDHQALHRLHDVRSFRLQVLVAVLHSVVNLHLWAVQMSRHGLAPHFIRFRIRDILIKCISSKCSLYFSKAEHIRFVMQTRP